jgi:hypothetical protein
MFPEHTLMESQVAAAAADEQEEEQEEEEEEPYWTSLVDARWMMELQEGKDPQPMPMPIPMFTLPQYHRRMNTLYHRKEVTEGAFLDVCTLYLLDQLLELSTATATATANETLLSPKQLWQCMTTILSQRHGLAGWILPQLEPTDFVGLGGSENEDEEDDYDRDYLSLCVQLVQRVYQVSVQQEKQSLQQQPPRAQKRRKLLLTSSSSSTSKNGNSHRHQSTSTKKWRLPVAYLWALILHQTTTTSVEYESESESSCTNNHTHWSELESTFLKLCRPCYKPMTHLDTHAALALLGWQLLADQQEPLMTSMPGLTASTVTSLLSRTEYVYASQTKILESRR